MRKSICGCQSTQTQSSELNRVNCSCANRPFRKRRRPCLEGLDIPLPDALTDSWALHLEGSPSMFGAVLGGISQKSDVEMSQCLPLAGLL